MHALGEVEFVPIKGAERFLVGANGVVINTSWHHSGQEKIVRPRLSNCGYPIVSIFMGGKVCTLSVHRLVAAHFLPNPANKSQVNHKDGDKTNNHVSNLEWATSSENQMHRYHVLKRHATQEYRDRVSQQTTGEGNPRAILTARDVAEIKKMLTQRAPVKALAARYGVSIHTIYDIRKGKSWAHLQKAEPKICTHWEK